MEGVQVGVRCAMTADEQDRYGAEAASWFRALCAGCLLLDTLWLLPCKLRRGVRELKYRLKERLPLAASTHPLLTSAIPYLNPIAAVPNPKTFWKPSSALTFCDEASPHEPVDCRLPTSFNPEQWRRSLRCS